MAAEVDMQDYDFRPMKSLAQLYAEMDAQKEQAARDPSASQLTALEKLPNFFYNPLHDLESLWWIAVYFVLKHEAIQDTSTVPAESDDEWDSDIQLDYANTLFYGALERDSAVRGRGDFLGNMLRVLHRTMQPIALRLEALRRELVQAYREAEKDVDTMDHNCASSLYPQFHTTFSDLAAAEDIQQLCLRGLVYRPFVPPVYTPDNSEPVLSTGRTDDGDVIMSDSSSSHEPQPSTTQHIPNHRYNLRTRTKPSRRRL